MTQGHQLGVSRIVQVAQCAERTSKAFTVPRHFAQMAPWPQTERHLDASSPRLIRIVSENMASEPSIIGQRKADHLDLCNDEQVEARERTTLLGDVTLIHDSLPELDSAAIDMSTTFLGHTIRLPVMISGMTGGIERAGQINRLLAEVAEHHGMPFGLGSQRAILKDRNVAATYQVRDVAPTTLIFGNIGAVQAAEMTTAELEDLVGIVGASALCIHLNPGQEIIQDHGDRDFRGCLDGIARAASELSVPVIAKETGCGLSPRTLDKLVSAGVRAVDVSGVGGTTWVGVEALRGQSVRQAVGETLWDWGVPTAAGVAFAHKRGLEVIASGGLRDGQDAAKSIALGAQLTSSALPWLRAAMNGGMAGAEQVAETLTETLRAVMLLTGSRNLDELRTAPKLIGPALRDWLTLDV
ncbi:MAG: isopentenyl-diphosphate delta-isomerase [Bradymonadia bacterium]|jgi:isopentenyl-diphosphate delta-isomerase